MYEIFEHTADLGIRVRAADLDSLLAESGRALFAVIVQDLDSIRPITRYEFEVAGAEPEFLLVDWLSELLFAFESRGLLFCEFSISSDSRGLRAVARGERLNETRHRLEHEVKAVTYHGLKVQATKQGWIAEVILDI